MMRTALLAGSALCWIGAAQAQTTAAPAGTQINPNRVIIGPAAGQLAGGDALAAEIARAQQSEAGAVQSAPSGAAQSSTQTSDYSFNSISALTDTIKQSGGSVFGVSNLSLKDVLPGGHTGGRNVIVGEVDLNGPSLSNSGNRDYVGGYFRGIANSGDGGTASNYLGAVFGINPVVACNNGATFLLDCTATESDAGMYAGASAAYRIGHRIASFGTAKGTLLDAGEMFITLDPNSTGFNRGIVFGSFGGSPNPVNGLLISGAGDGQIPLTAVGGIDFTGYTFSGYSLALPGGFVVAPTGITTAPGFTAAAATYPKVLFNAAANAADQKQWQEFVDPSGSLALTTLNDAGSAVTPGMVITRGAGYSVLGVSFTGTITATSATTPKLILTAASNAADAKTWQLYEDTSGNVDLTTVNDAGTAASAAMTIHHGSGYLAQDVTFPVPVVAQAGQAVTGGMTADVYKSAGAVGVSCPAGTVNLSTLTFTNGIATHC